MPNRHYTNGRAMEYRVKERLEEQGWTCFRTAGSKSPCDLVAFWPYAMTLAGQIAVPVFVQVKSGVRPMPRRERDAFKTFALSHGARPLLVTRGMVFNWLDEQEEAAA